MLSVEHNAIRKLASISQHSSISQADDVSSPYARVKLPANHAYDQLRITEHPYAQVTAVSHGNQPNTVSNVVVGLNRTASSAGTSSNAHNNTSGTSSNAATNGDDSSTVDGPSRRGSNESLLGGNTSHEVSNLFLGVKLNIYVRFFFVLAHRTFLLRRQSQAECRPAKSCHT